MNIADYTATQFVNGNAPAISAGELNKLGTGVEDNRGFIQQLEANKIALEKHAYTLTSSNWTGSSEPFSYTVSISGLESSNDVLVDIDLSNTGNYDDKLELIDLWSWTTEVIVNAGSLTINTRVLPNKDIDIIILVVK